MGNDEMSQEFDILYNQVNSNQASSVDEYEKSVFLTKAQDELIKAYFDPRGNKFIEGFDDGQKRQYDFSSLVKNVQIDTETSVDMKYDPRSKVYMLPQDLFLMLNESIMETECGTNYIYQILPISYAQYQVLMQKPYQYPTKRAAWRLITGQVEASSTGSNGSNGAIGQGNATPGNDRGGSAEAGTVCEIIGRFKTNNIHYKLRYVKKPKPIVLVDLGEQYGNLTIDNVSEATECELPEGIHHEIVQRAVELATAVYNPQALGTITGVGNVSATNLGIIPRQESK